MSTLPADLAGLLRPDGAVLVPGEVAGELLAAAVRDMTARARRDGLSVSPRAVVVLQALHVAAERHDTDRFANEPPPRPAAKVEIDSEDAAQRMGCTAQHVTRLCRAGRITGRQVGRVWLIDRASLDSYRFRRPS
ncbi:hypothetical protein CSH63_29300 [Micromonospora tulbaghiae]|uniref:Helix-turn-helix domain-containing protein n=1 Tax=Micromonospora tulbaghiae TaxID=479978 RepID=A0A386WTE8_9ACTN|nr:helix-turn-helix domain-containing protein [Micromonospora tulbaghiae]AYF31471.1 hypothetical protein CSH63_29300 [Micromonospora tulbaghiae]